MPSNKKKNSADKKRQKQQRRTRQATAQDLKEVAPKFRQLLLSARQEYAKGRSYNAVETQNEAIELGTRKLPRFDDDSLVKAHAMLELSLAKSAVMTDFASGDEHSKLRVEWHGLIAEIMTIYESRVAAGTLAVWRRDEVWMEGGDYESPVPHTERLGPVDYLQTMNFRASMAFGEPTVDSVRSIKTAISFLHKFEASGCVVQLECGGAVQGEVPPDAMGKLKGFLSEHESVLSGLQTTVSPGMFEDAHEEVRHTGTLDGEMKKTGKKLAKDMDKIGLKNCFNPKCNRFEHQPKQFAKCTRCGFAVYCGRECQKADWKRHKKECSTLAKRAEEEVMQNKSKNCLHVGQSQQVLTLIRFFHHFALCSFEFDATETAEAEMAKVLVKPQLEGHDLGTVQLDMQSVSIAFAAIWSMDKEDRADMVRNFQNTVKQVRFPGMDFSIVTEWSQQAVAGDFTVVKHTDRGTILLHEHEDGEIRGYCAVGITQSLESLFQQHPEPMPFTVNTGLLPFKKVVLCQGTIMSTCKPSSPELEAIAKRFVDGEEGVVRIIERFG